MFSLGGKQFFASHCTGTLIPGNCRLIIMSTFKMILGMCDFVVFLRIIFLFSVFFSFMHIEAQICQQGLFHKDSKMCFVLHCG